MYYIYHIPGIKIGCTKELNKRIKRQGFDEFIILEKYDDIEIASKREYELQKEYGYKKDNKPYHLTISMASKGGLTTGKSNGLKLKNSGKLKEIAKLGGLKQGPIQGKINKENGHMSNLGKKMTDYNNRSQICPYCGITSKGIGYTRWHGENCKFK